MSSNTRQLRVTVRTLGPRKPKQPKDLESILVARGIVEPTPPEEPQTDELAEPGFLEERNEDAS